MEVSKHVLISVFVFGLRKWIAMWFVPFDISLMCFGHRQLFYLFFFEEKDLPMLFYGNLSFAKIL